ncbi:MAG: heme biosynthesis HemY N-terminal domain-containing protein [Mariprofundales bacterium]
MRFWLTIILLVAISIGLALFPTVASQMMTIEVMGWHLEMKQGAFLALVLLLVVVVRLLLWLVRIVIKGPSHLLAAWRNGGHKRQETRVRNGLMAWANGDRVVANAFDVSTAVLPAWLAAALAALVHPEQQDGASDTPLAAALRGRALSDDKQVALALRQQAVAAWCTVAPRSALAQQRALQLAEEAEDWQAVLDVMDQAPRGVVVEDGSARRANALLHLAQDEPATALTQLRQAAKLADSDEIVLALAAAHRAGDDLKSARTVLLDRLDKCDSLVIAKALATQEGELDNPLLTLHMLDKRCRKSATVAQRWLLVMLSRQAEDHERIHHHLRLLKQMAEGNRLAWQIEADLHMENSDWESAAHCYQQAMIRSIIKV